MADALPESPGSALARRGESGVQFLRPSSTAETTPSAFNTKDAIFAVFKHKWLVVFCTLLGIGAAVLFYRFYPPLYESQAKLLVRYVVERSAVDSVDNNSVNSSHDSDSAIASEAEIVSSWDLAVKVADVIGPQRLLPGQGTVTREQAAGTISHGLEVTFGKGSSILFVNYKNQDPQLATIVLDELIKQYFIKHLEVHRSSDAFDFVTQQIDRVKSQLNQTEDALIPLKAQLGIISLSDGQAALSAELARSEGQLHDAEAELADQQARVKEIEKDNAGGPAPSPKSAGSSSKPSPSASASPASTVRPGLLVNEASAASDADLQKYQVLVAQLEQLRQSEVALLSKYTPGSTQVQQIEAQQQETLKDKLALEKKFPDLPSRLPASSNRGGQGIDLTSERVRLAGMEARVTALRTLLGKVKERMKQMSEVGPQVAELDRKKELEDANYKYFSGTLEKARVDEALDPSKIPNISAVQKASPPVQVTAARNKETLMIAASGLGLGLALALLRGLLLDRTLKRPLEVEQQLDTSLLLSIPFMADAQTAALPSVGAGPSGKQIALNRQPAPWDAGHFIKPYCEAIRDRISLYFELNQLTHKPKLVGVTSFSPGAGTSTMAAGLAAALSETGEGKVLLVDVNLGPEDVHPFFRGRPAYTLKAALLEGVAMDAASENLYLAKVGSNAGPAQLGLKKFFEMIPNLKASDFDYVVFDMPYLEQTSPAWGMAAFMDKLLVIVEAEKSHRTLVSRGYRKLVSERNNVSVIFNKARSYVPKLLDGEYHY